jgi:hypothetical protein
MLLAGGTGDKASTESLFDVDEASGTALLRPSAHDVPAAFIAVTSTRRSVRT